MIRSNTADIKFLLLFFFKLKKKYNKTTEEDNSAHVDLYHVNVQARFLLAAIGHYNALVIFYRLLFKYGKSIDHCLDNHRNYYFFSFLYSSIVPAKQDIKSNLWG